MKLTIEELELIEKFSAGTLEEGERQLLEQISDWKDATVFQGDFLESLSISKLEDVKSNLMLFEEEFQYAQAKEGSLSIFEKIKQQIDLTLDEIASLFQPVSDYQPYLRLATASRGELKVNKAVFEENRNTLSFELSKDASHSLQLTVENNLQEVLVRKELSKKVGAKFEVKLDGLQSIPGRYYWRLVMNRDSVMDEFFIGKDLMKRMG